jgi:hypothetical protein
MDLQEVGCGGMDWIELAIFEPKFFPYKYSNIS